MNAIARARQTFLHECRDLLARMEDALQQLQADPDDGEALDALFRAAHTIKGSGGLFDFQSLVEFTHAMESVLEHAREGGLAVDLYLIGLLLRCRDHLETLVDAIVDGEGEAGTVQQDADLLRALAAVLDGRTLRATALGPATVTTRTADDHEGTWHISVRFGPDLFRKALSPVPILRYLAGLGDITHVATLADGMPAAADMDPESCYLGLEIRLRSTADKAAIEDAFEFTRDDCELRMLPPGSRVEDYLRLIEELPEDPARLGEILVRCGAVTPRELEDLLELQAADADVHAPIGALAVREGVAPPEVVGAALARQGEVRRQKAAEGQLIRVRADKLDRLIDRVGELVVASAGVAQTAARIGEGGLLESMSGMTRLVEDIREDAMRLRMVEIGETFDRFRRIVRDIARQLGKEIELVIEGGGTELDKSLVEQIAEPLTHLVRNAIDHGIEDAVLRASRGKPARGRIRLSAHHEGGSVVIEVADDGGGLDRARILTRARQLGLLADNAQPSDAEAWNLIFTAGFSTAAQVTDISGRGVGMDVVKRSIEALRGSIETTSVPGQGTTFRIRLPLTLAIIGGFLMGVGESHYVAPLDCVTECVELHPGMARGSYLDLRGEVLPLLRLRDYFGLPGGDARRQSVVVVSSHGSKAGLVVDRLEGELQTVIKPMGRLFARLVGISGTTILGSGEVALLLDVPSLLSRVADQRQPASLRHH